MPRLTNSDSGPFDFCRPCFPDMEDAEENYRYPVAPDANDGRGDFFEYECDHPPYDCEDYTCEGCGKSLTGRDD